MNNVYQKFRSYVLDLSPKGRISALDRQRDTVKGFIYKNKEFIHHSDLHPRETSFYNLLLHQKIIFLGILAILGAAFLLNWHLTLIVLFSTMTVIYFTDFIFNAFIIYRSFSTSPEIQISAQEIGNVPENFWPTYTIFCPLYKEWQVVPQFVKAMEQLDYPKDKLQILFLLEENDSETIEKVTAAKLPPQFEVAIVPHSNPKTKPKAMNFGLQYASGEYLVIYDAEDKPEIDQLKKAVLAFKKCHNKVVCVQAKLNFYNPKQNVLTRMFTAEYSLWFDLTLPGLQSINAPIPLGGTSNHFKTNSLKQIGGWDAFNVTEDCDLGLRLAKRGYRTAIMESTTYEEANSNIHNWYNQRSRWIKGYIQTYFVHSRSGNNFFGRSSFKDLFVFQFMVGVKIMALFINPFMWALTACYFIFRAQAGPFIESLYPGPILFLGEFSLIFGNFFYIYYYMIACAKRDYHGLIKYVFLVPLYWLGMSLAAWKAVYEVIVKPHYWAKTHHGLHLGVGIEWEPNKLWGQVTSSGGFLVLAMIVANVINFIFNAYLGRTLSLEEFGVVSIMSTFVYLLNIFVNSMGSAITYSVSFLEGKNPGTGSHFFRKLWVRVLITGFISSILWLVAVPAIADYFNVSSYIIIASFAPAVLFGTLNSFNGGYLAGMLSFGSIAVLSLVEVVAKLGVAFFLVEGGFASFVSLSIPASIICVWLGSTIAATLIYKQVPDDQKSVPEKNKFPFAFYSAALVRGVSLLVFLGVDVILAKHYLSPSDAGRYAMLSLVGKMIFFFGALLNAFIMPIVSRNLGAGINPAKTFYKLFAGTLFLTLSASLGLSVLGFIFVPLLLGSEAVSIVPFLPLYSIAIALFTLSTTLVQYQLARKRYLFSVLSFAISLMMVMSIVSSHASIASLVTVIFAINVIFFAVVAFATFFYGLLAHIGRDAVDALRVFRRLPAAPPLVIGGKRMLIFNWRDTENAYAGGAEIYIHEMAKRWAASGNSITLFTSNDGRQEPNGEIDGVRVIRRGGFYGVYPLAALYYLIHFRGRVDVIIDCENGIPFFSPLYVKEPVYCLLHHIHQEVFRTSLMLPLASLASFLEKRMMPLVYSNSTFITISDSSKQEMQALGITNKEINIVHPGVDLKFLSPGDKSATPLVSYVGRLKDYKSVHLLIQAFARIIQKVPETSLIIAGDGDEKIRLVKLASRLGLADKIHFYGKVTEARKLEIMRASWVFVNPSMMEGWGITTIEANACGTPVVASDVPGLRDSVKDGETGLLSPYGDIDALAEKITSLLLNGHLRDKLAAKAIVWSKQFAWDKSSEIFLRNISGTPLRTANYETVSVE